MVRLTDLYARQILDSRGNPTLEVELYADEYVGTAAIPSGASTGVHEAKELRDGKDAYGGKGVMKAVMNVNTTIRDGLRDIDVTDQENLDTHLRLLDGTPNKAVLGANAILGVSLAACRAASAAHALPLFEHLAQLAGNKKLIVPIPFANVINGGVHACNHLQPQEFMIVPTGAKTFSEATQIVSETYQELKGLLKKKFGPGAANVGDEGGFAPPISTADEAFALLSETLRRLGYEKKVCFAMDPAASEFYKEGSYEVEAGKKLYGDELITYWMKLLKKYPIISLEDPFAEDDYESWAKLMNLIAVTPATDFGAGIKPQIVGDDLTVTNPDRIRKAIKQKLCNTLLLKVNQIGTLSEAIEAANLAFEAGWNVMVSHRSGETEDPFIADLAVGLGCGQIKIGAPCRSDRTAKYNQLLRITEEIDGYARFQTPK